MKLYKRIIARLYFQYSVVWKKTKGPILYTVSLLSILNYSQVLMAALTGDILFKTRMFEAVGEKEVKLPFLILIFALFYIINYQILKRIILDSNFKFIKEYSNSKKLRRRDSILLICYILFSILFLFILAYLAHVVLHTTADGS